MKKLFFLFLIAMLTPFFAGCGPENTADPKPDNAGVGQEQDPDKDATVVPGEQEPVLGEQEIEPGKQDGLPGEQEAAPGDQEQAPTEDFGKPN